MEEGSPRDKSEVLLYRSEPGGNAFTCQACSNLPEKTFGFNLQFWVSTLFQGLPNREGKLLSLPLIFLWLEVLRNVERKKLSRLQHVCYFQPDVQGASTKRNRAIIGLLTDHCLPDSILSVIHRGNKGEPVLLYRNIRRNVSPSYDVRTSLADTFTDAWVPEQLALARSEELRSNELLKLVPVRAKVITPLYSPRN